MSAGLAASTVTPGNTAPLVSLTTPATTPVWAHAAAGWSVSHASASRVTLMDIRRVMNPPHSELAGRSDALSQTKRFSWVSEAEVYYCRSRLNAHVTERIVALVSCDSNDRSSR